MKIIMNGAKRDFQLEARIPKREIFLDKDKIKKL